MFLSCIERKLWQFLHNRGHTVGHIGSHFEFLMNCKNYMVLTIITEILTPQWRVERMSIVELAGEYNPEFYLQLMGFPKDIPDLSRLRPPDGNTRPKGIKESHFAKHVRGELPATY